jgi:hypothetical protein
MTVGSASTNTINIGRNNTAGSVNITGVGTIKANTFDCVSATGATINLFGTNTERIISLGPNQTSGAIRIGDSASRTGNVNIAQNAISGSINIGSSGTTTNITGGITLTNPLTLPTTTTTPSTTQLGYFANSTTATAITVSATNSTPAAATITNLPIGIYIVNYYAVTYSPTIGATQVMTYSVTTTGGATSNIPTYVFNGVATTFQDTQNLNGVVKCTTATNTIVFNLIITSGGGTASVSFFGYNYIKIG